MYDKPQKREWQKAKPSTQDRSKSLRMGSRPDKWRNAEPSMSDQGTSLLMGSRPVNMPSFFEDRAADIDRASPPEAKKKSLYSKMKSRMSRMLGARSARNNVRLFTHGDETEV